MLKDKAAKNLRAGEALATLGFVDAAASRYYYALYQAAVSALTRQGWSPGALQSGAVEWGHVVVMNNVFLVRRRRSDHALYKAMRDMRTQADYDDESVEAGDLATQVESLRAFVEEALR